MSDTFNIAPSGCDYISAGKHAMQLYAAPFSTLQATLFMHGLAVPAWSHGCMQPYGIVACRDIVTLLRGVQ